MYNKEKIKIKLLSGFNTDISIDTYDDYYCNFTESQYYSLSHFISAGTYFPQIIQFALVLSIILGGKTSGYDIIHANVISGVTFTLLRFLLRFYKIPGLAFIAHLIGSVFFRNYLHFVAIAIISFFVVKDWKVLLFCAIGGAITIIIKIILYALLSNTKYNDSVVKYVSAFRYKM